MHNLKEKIQETRETRALCHLPQSTCITVMIYVKIELDEIADK